MTDKKGIIPAAQASSYVLSRVFAMVGHIFEKGGVLMEDLHKGKEIKYEDISFAINSAGGKRRKRDPNLPPKAKTAYILFSEEKRPSYKDKNIPLVDVTRDIARQWREIDPNEKKRLEAKADKEKLKYQELLKEYEQNLNSHDAHASSSLSSSAPQELSDESEGESQSTKRKRSDSEESGSEDEKKKKKHHKEHREKEHKGKEHKEKESKEKESKKKEHKHKEHKEKEHKEKEHKGKENKEKKHK